MKRPTSAPKPVTLVTFATASAILAAGCGADRSSSGFSVSEELRGDTVVMVSRGEPERVRVDEVEVFLRSEELSLESDHLRAMARVGDHLVIGDRDRVHLVSTRDAGMRTFGRSGDGPGEFREIHAVGEFGADTIGVYGFWTRTVSLFSLEGEFLGSHRVTPQPPFPRPHGEIYPLVKSGSGILWTRTSYLASDTAGTQSKALVWHDLEADTAAVLEARHWQQWEVSPAFGLANPRDVFPDRVVHAISARGRVASGDPTGYCIRLFHAFAEDVRVACRERSRVPVTAGFHAPDLTLLDNPMPPPVAAHLAWQNRADSLPHFDRLQFSESGDLWVRTYHEELAHTHPFLLRPQVGLWVHHPLQPTVREWDVFDPDGVLVRQVTLPAAFDLRVVGDGEAFGFLTLDTGEIAIGRADLTAGERVAGP